MSLPEESVAANTLPEVTTIPTGKKLIFTDPDTNEGGIITLENLTKQILQNLTSQTFTLDQGNLTLLQALIQLNSNTMKHVSTNSDITPLIDSAKQFNRKLISFDAYTVPAFFPSSSHWWMGFIALNGPGTYGTMIAFSFSDNAIYTCCWNGSTDKNDWVKIS